VVDVEEQVVEHDVEHEVEDVEHDEQLVLHELEQPWLPPQPDCPWCFFPPPPEELHAEAVALAPMRRSDPRITAKSLFMATPSFAGRRPVTRAEAGAPGASRVVYRSQRRLLTARAP
jgi:hypothetical protein